MTPEQKIARLEKTLGTLIAWLSLELGANSVSELLEMLTTEDE